MDKLSLGTMVWGAIVFLSLAVSAIFNPPKKWPKIKKIILPAFISDVVVHIIVVLKDGVMDQ